ncbi:MAG: outer membrane beta-barrel protein [candidate division Zixibacteria bacterium]|nr:outer membrane beta-barrel protein [candidate division Zixibacteria bacterium]
MMKRIILILISALFLFTLSLSAQDDDKPSYAIDKGSILAGGSAGFVSVGGDARADERVSIFTFNPTFMYFALPNVAVGGQVMFRRQSTEDDSDTFYGAGPIAAYFFGGEESVVFPFVSMSFIYGKETDQYTETALRFTGGTTYMVAKNVGLTGEIFYLIENISPENSDESVSGNTFGVGLGLSAFIF